MKKKILNCPECRCKKFASIYGLNVHLGKNHSVDYKITIQNNRLVIRNKTKLKITYVESIQA